MFLASLLQDLRIGFRILVKEQAFCALAVMVLALGICAVTTQFSFVNGLLLRGLSFPGSDRLVAVNFIDPSQANFFGVAGQVQALDYEEFRPEQRSLERVAAYLNGSTINLTDGDQPRRYTGGYVTEDFMRILGVTPVLGRDFTAADNRPGAPRTALLSHRTWQRDFGGAEDIVGRAVRINGAAGTIIGVMPPGFAFPVNEELWVPLFAEFPPVPRDDPRAINPAVLGRLRPGVSLEQARLEFDAFARRFAAAYPATNRAFATGEVKPLREVFTPPLLRGLMLGMLAICVLVLVIACLNVMNMQFARATRRAREFAIRSSLGATRARLMRQMLTESLLLAAIGATLGVGGAFWAVDYLAAVAASLPNPPPSWISFTIDGPVLAFTVLATLAAAVTAGLVPAWVASRSGAAAALRESGRGNTGQFIPAATRALVVFQLILTSAILVTSVLLARSLHAQQSLDYGYDTRGVLAARMGLMEAAYPTAADRAGFYARLLRELPACPEFAAVALTNRFRMTFSGNAPVEIEGRVYAENKDRPNANFENIAGDYFAVTGQRLLDGRAFTAADSDQHQPVAIVNAAFAERHFGREPAVGHRVRTVGNNGTQFGPWRTIVGVVSTVRMLGPFVNANVDDTGFYLPLTATVFGPVTAEPFAGQFATLAVRPGEGRRAEALADVVRREVRRLDGNLPLYFVETPAASHDTFIAQNRIAAGMVGVFGAVAFLLSAIGLYGVTSFAVTQRTQEFGVRLALGADPPRILRLVLGQGLRQLALGLGVGLGLTLVSGAAARGTLATFLPFVSPTDPLAYFTVGLLIAVVSLVATLIPARRATRIDPLVALRAE